MNNAHDTIGNMIQHNTSKLIEEHKLKPYDKYHEV